MSEEDYGSYEWFQCCVFPWMTMDSELTYLELGERAWLYAWDGDELP